MDYQKASDFIINKIKTELPGNLYYHSYNHVMDVLQAAIQLGEMENLSEYDLTLLKTAVLFHDSGFIKQNNEHEAIGCEIAKESLPNFNYSTEQIETICGMIMATKIPQTPNNLLEQIICDADLDYLGRDDFWVIGNHLFMELKMYGVLKNENDWNLLQLKFLTKHNYFTKSAIMLRQEKKNDHIEKIKTLTKNI
ncbi:MAG: HD domain-containing protein [Bacteroidia bacterium]|nr:HD domain-containing protein [Bacteroidia bacterium]